MIGYIVRRLLIMVPVMIGVSFLSFLILHLVPGNPAVIMAGVGASAADIHHIEIELGLNHTLLYQYGVFLGHLVRGDLGRSISTSRPVVQELAERLPVTVALAVAGTVLAILLGLGLGLVAAARPGRGLDLASGVVTLFGLSMPSFWLGLMLILVFAVKLPWFPVAGWNGFSSIVLPAITLGSPGIAVVARMSRRSLIDAMGSDYIRTARAKGLGEAKVFIRHALKNALIPVITVVGVEFGTLLGGAVITEDVFAIPGAGRLIVSAINARDYPTVEGVILVVSMLFVLVNLATDILYTVVDPRIHYS